MTKQEIQALIDAKIKGQGNQIDIAGVLPSVLTAILEIAEAGANVQSDWDESDSEAAAFIKHKPSYAHKGIAVVNQDDNISSYGTWENLQAKFGLVLVFDSDTDQFAYALIISNGSVCFLPDGRIAQMPTGAMEPNETWSNLDGYADGTARNFVRGAFNGENLDDEYSTALGLESSATGNCSFAAGNGATAYEDDSIAMGNHAMSTGGGAVSIGPGAVATGEEAVSIGTGTEAAQDNEVAVGKLNKSVQGGRFSVGIGVEVEDSDPDRKNGILLMDDGTIYIVGIGGFNGKNEDDPNVSSLQDVISSL